MNWLELWAAIQVIGTLMGLVAGCIFVVAWLWVIAKK